MHLLERAAASVAAQSLACIFIPIIDSDRRGVTWARNEGIRKAQTKFITFLDADDELDQDFADRTIDRWRPNHYVYSDFWFGDELCTLPDGDALNERAHHIVNCLMTKAAAVAVGGFSAHDKFEDTLFYLNLREKGICGIRCPYPLVRYNHKQGVRSRDVHKTDHWAKELRALMASKPCNCGESGGIPIVPKGEKLEGDILVYCMWQGNRGHTGVTGRRYEKNGWGMPAWIDPRDAYAAPELYKIAEIITPDAPKEFDELRQEFLALAGV